MRTVCPLGRYSGSKPYDSVRRAFTGTAVKRQSSLFYKGSGTATPSIFRALPSEPPGPCPFGVAGAVSRSRSRVVPGTLAFSFRSLGRSEIHTWATVSSSHPIGQHPDAEHLLPSLLAGTRASQDTELSPFASANIALLLSFASSFFGTGMDFLDHAGSLAEMGALLAQGRLKLQDEAIFYVRVSEGIPPRCSSAQDTL